MVLSTSMQHFMLFKPSTSNIIKYNLKELVSNTINLKNFIDWLPFTTAQSNLTSLLLYTVKCNLIGLLAIRTFGYSENCPAIRMSSSVRIVRWYLSCWWWWHNVNIHWAYIKHTCIFGIVTYTVYDSAEYMFGARIWKLFVYVWFVKAMYNFFGDV